MRFITIVVVYDRVACGAFDTFVRLCGNGATKFPIAD
jgi:hypothetical protein